MPVDEVAVEQVVPGEVVGVGPDHDVQQLVGREWGAMDNPLQLRNFSSAVEGNWKLGIKQLLSRSKAGAKTKY